LYIQENDSNKMSYVISDHLGSAWALANEQGGFVEKYEYDPWGKRVNPDDWTQDDVRTSFKTDRGFTLHSLSRTCFGKHFDHLQFINMQARLYDPFLGQFISVDPLADKYPGWGAYYDFHKSLLAIT